MMHCRSCMIMLKGRVKHFMPAIVRALQRIVGANAAPIRQGLPLECLCTLGGKEFGGVRGGDLTRAEYWLEGVIRILGSPLVDDSRTWYCTQESDLGLFLGVFPEEVCGKAVSGVKEMRVHGCSPGYFFCRLVRS
ncbi:hypothetical protein GOBAR_AA13720 [Gossypium barbadense]|uniref:Uncharacterized protein n=1 Tax=Gossypium barbadense TaxID=3634 RepID=A0A2P5XUF9_GOSBA|nr:hypothetical protein GOBAR_AA13720 [Gossypium barbadense]